MLTHTNNSNAIRLAYRYYARHAGDGQSPACDLALHADGLVVWSRELVAMARPVRSTAPVDLIINPRVSFTDADAWHVHLLCGDMRALAMLRESILTYPLITYQREGGRLRLMRSARLAEFI